MRHLTHKMASLRLAFNTKQWTPTKEQWLRSATLVQIEEQERIGRFVFRKDAKSAMAGRLLIRKAIEDTLHISNLDINLARSDKGKPYLVNVDPSLPEFNFNVSHQGSFAVLASEPCHTVGVDVMQTEYPRGKSPEDFFSTMNRQFTAKEWATIKRPYDEWEQLANFYRFWCLKESYVKAVGVGIGFSLQRLEFHINSNLVLGKTVNNTKIYVDGKCAVDWCFHETMLDETHCVVVALQKNSDPMSAQDFTVLTFDDMTKSLVPLREEDENYWSNFAKKEEKPEGR